MTVRGERAYWGVVATNLLALGAVVALLPDPTLTPGAINEAASVALICKPGYTSQPGVRHVTEADKHAAFLRYHVDPKQGGPYEIDHLVSLELGGSNDAKNLWPQSYVSQSYNAHMKDQLENRLHAEVCEGKVSLGDAQGQIARDWIAAYHRWVKP